MKTASFRRHLLTVALLVGLAAQASIVAAQSAATPQPMPRDYPSKPIRVVVPSPPGGPPDLVLRALTPRMSAVLGQPLVVENNVNVFGELLKSIKLQRQAE